MPASIKECGARSSGRPLGADAALGGAQVELALRRGESADCGSTHWSSSLIGR